LPKNEILSIKLIAMKILIITIWSLCCLNLSAQQGKSFRITSTYAMFPDSIRNKEPRIYDGKTYTASEHYNDSSAYIFVPDYFDKNKPFTYVVYFHGWGNNIDSALVQYKLKEQFYNAQLNAIFIFPEGPKNAPDSYGGKFEKPDTFNYFMKDAEQFLKREKLITTKQQANIIYAGHSGAYRVMSYLLLHSTYNCKGILLFDALYAELEKFSMYLQMHPSCKLIDIYTDNGGTIQNSKILMTDMLAWHWPFLSTEEDDVTQSQLKTNRIIFLHSKNKHNDVVSLNNNFTRFLQAVF
jgi:predicted esterase